MPAWSDPFFFDVMGALHDVKFTGDANGRLLTDDVIDVFLPILTNGKVNGDKVGPHRDLLAEFPFLGPPHLGG